MINVFIVDDHPVMADGIAALLAEYPDVNVMGVESMGEEAIPMILEQQPDIVLQDINLKGISGNKVMEEVLKAGSTSKFIFFTVLPTNAYAIQLIREGASGFLNKNVLLDEMVEAIRAVSRGKTYLTSELKMLLAEQNTKAKGTGLELLSKREFEIFLRLVDGARQVDIEKELDIGHSTLSTYIARIHRKLGTKTVADLVRWAVQEDVITQ